MNGKVLNALRDSFMRERWESAFQSRNRGNQMIAKALLPHKHSHKLTPLTSPLNQNSITAPYGR